MKKSLGLIGVGAFGTLAARHLAAHVDLVLHDVVKDVVGFAQEIGAQAGDLKQAAACDIVVLAVPVQRMAQILQQIAPLLKPHALFCDVASVKVKPVAAMLEILPPEIAIVGTHPLFGPQSGKNGIAGLNIALCDIRGGRLEEVERFCVQKLQLKTMIATPEEHDRELAYVQGLTHMLAKIVASLNLPPMRMTTRSYELMMQVVEMLRYDSDDLFRAIERENPFSSEAKRAFFDAAQALDDKLSG